jgi:hypothetical protein
VPTLQRGQPQLARVGDRSVGGLLLDRPHAPRAQEYDGAAASHVVEYCLVRRTVRPEPTTFPHTAGSERYKPNPRGCGACA